MVALRWFKKYIKNQKLVSIIELQLEMLWFFLILQLLEYITIITLQLLLHVSKLHLYLGDLFLKVLQLFFPVKQKKHISSYFDLFSQ